ncbi:hypothetical protein BGZ63DRAFT_187222 [Mariannaea sp. PMI_226]|nr:hypothetical protein BGZ63DRAFT_187222 [Mariannaea sp. PMI_226]
MEGRHNAQGGGEETKLYYKARSARLLHEDSAQNFTQGHSWRVGECRTNKVKLQLCTQGLSAKGWQMTLRLNRDRDFALCLKVDRLPRTYGEDVSQLPR